MVNIHGEQYHHAHPSVLTDQLYLAAARAISARVLLDLGITCIINATLELPTMAYHNQDCLQIAVEDRVASKLYVYFDLVADKINSVHNSNGKTMIYCRAGMSRSASLCIAYFIKYHDMSMDDAFDYVKKRRPIIHPNVGFLRQLRDYEKKLRNHQQHLKSPSSSKKSFDLPALMFAAECCSSQEKYDDYETGIKIIKPRPKPRLPKIQLSEILDLSAETYQITVVELCSVLPDSAPSCVPLSLSLESSKTALVAAESMCPACLEYLGIYDAGEEAHSYLKMAFTKISEPAKIAVSFVSIPLDSPAAEDNEKKAMNVNYCTASFSVLSELLPLPEVAEEVLLECLGHVSKTLSSSIPESASVGFAIPNHHSPVSFCTESVFECGVVMHEKMPPLQCLGVQYSAPQPLPPPSKRPALARSNSRLSLKRSAVKIPAKPEKIKKSMKEEAASYLTLCVGLVQPTVWYTTKRNIEPLSVKRYKLDASIFAPLTCATVGDADSEAFELVIRDPNSSFKPSWLLTVSRRTVIECTAVEVERPSIMETEELLPFSVSVLPSREFPYYSLVKRDPEAVEMFKAMELPNIESCHFVTLAPRKSSKTVCMVPMVEEFKPKKEKRKLTEPVIQWASERYHIDMDATLQTCKPISNVEIGKAIVRYGGVRFRLMYAIGDESIFPTEDPVLIPRMQVQKYSSYSISNMCHSPLYGIATINHVETYVMNNFYCEPTTIPSQCKEVVYWSVVMAPEATCTDVQDDLVELVDIPDVMGDIGALKQQLMKQNDHVKISIWLDIFKRSVIRARPIFPFVSVREMFAVTDITETVACEDGEDESDIVFENNSCHAYLAMELILPYEVIDQEPSEMCDETGFEAHTDLPDTAEVTVAIKTTFEVYCIYISVVLDAPFIMSIPQRVKYLPTYPSSRLAPFQTVANVQETCCNGETVNLGPPVPSEWLARKPFRVIAPIPTLASITQVNLLTCGGEDLPPFVFVQELEENADCTNHPKADQTLDCVTETTDVLWFFEINKANEACSSAAPAGKGNYQLFLPDPESMERLGSESLDVFKPEKLNESLIRANPQPTIPRLSRPRDFFAGSKPKTLQRQASVTLMEGSNLKTLQRQTSCMEKPNPKALPRQAPFVEGPKTLQRQGSFMERPKTLQRQVSFKEPVPPPRLLTPSNPDSRSRPQERSGVADRRILANLNASVRHSNAVIDSRRSRSTCRPGNSTSDISSRYSTTSDGLSGAPARTETNVTYRGLLDVAQTWIGGRPVATGVTRSGSRSKLGKRITKKT